MTGWSIKRFWESAGVEPRDEGFAIVLDKRPVHTPGRSLLIVPTRPLAEAIATEWDAQTEKIDPSTMPMTRIANSAIDKVAAQKDEIAELLAAYSETDLLCYRASGPASLVERQAATWDPYLRWSEQHLGARLTSCQGVIPIRQEGTAAENLRARVRALTAFELAAFHDLVTLTGSLILAFATIHRIRPAEEIWNASRIDENWQIEQWGEDEEAKSREKQKFASFCEARRFFFLLEKKAERSRS